MPERLTNTVESREPPVEKHNKRLTTVILATFLAVTSAVPVLNRNNQPPQSYSQSHQQELGEARRRPIPKGCHKNGDRGDGEGSQLHCYAEADIDELVAAMDYYPKKD